MIKINSLSELVEEFFHEELQIKRDYDKCNIHLRQACIDVMDNNTILVYLQKTYESKEQLPDRSKFYQEAMNVLKERGYKELKNIEILK